jgi:hypothetical protein
MWSLRLSNLRHQNIRKKLGCYAFYDVERHFWQLGAISRFHFAPNRFVLGSRDELMSLPCEVSDKKIDQVRYPSSGA